jgi:hypothetical protein
MKKYQGEDIAFSLTFDNQDNPNIKDFGDVSNVIVYAYTGEDNIQKFSMVEKEGHSPLEIVTPDTIISGIISSKYTSKMSGQIIIEVMIEIPSETGDSKENLIKKAYSGIFIVPSAIKSSI